MTNQILTPSTGDATLGALVARLVQKGYYNGIISVMSYSDLPASSWTYTVKWQYSFDNAILVEIYQLYTGNKKWNWLYSSNGTWANSSWYDG